MTEEEIPFVGEALLRNLRERFPDRTPRAADIAANPNIVHQSAGRQEVIDHIADLLSAQTESSPHVLTRK